MEEYDFTVKHKPREVPDACGWAQPPARRSSTPEDTILQVRLLEGEDKARKIAHELHTATHLGGHTLWKLFRDR